MSGNSPDILKLAERLQPVRDGERFDVIVAGGGASGLMACVAAARHGAKVLVVESAGCFGGAATTSMVAQWLGSHNGEMRAVGGLPIEYAERIAARWADHRNVPQIAFKPDWTKHAKAAPFKRNDAMLEVLPIGVMIFPGTGIQENLADKARKLGIPVWRFGGT